MAHLIGLDFVAVQVRALQASRRFYTERLGLEVAPQSPPNAVVFRTEPIPFAVREPIVNLNDSPRLGWGVALWFLADNADTRMLHWQHKVCRSCSRRSLGRLGACSPLLIRTGTPSRCMGVNKQGLFLHGKENK